GCVWFWSAARRAALAALGLSTTVLWRWCCQYRDAAPVNTPRPISPVVAITSADQPRLSPTACAATAPAAARLATTRVWPGSSSAHSAACRCFVAARLVRSQDGTTLAVSAAPVATTPREAAPARSLVATSASWAAMAPPAGRPQYQGVSVCRYRARIPPRGGRGSGVQTRPGMP